MLFFDNFKASLHSPLLQAIILDLRLADRYSNDQKIFLFKAFACAGFFGYVAWCNSGENIAYLTIGMWIAAGLLTRNFGMLAAIVFAFLALGFQAYLIAV